jgi:hypothetical protein
MSRGTTKYSDDVPGTKRNYNWPVNFDTTDGFVGINQLGGGKVKDRVLLSPAQVKALVAWVSK